MIKMKSKSRQWPLTGVILLATGLAACGHLNTPIQTQPESPKSLASAQTADHALVSRAYTLLGVPYRYGGTSPKKGMDCSGLIYYVHRQEGKSVPRSTRRQYQKSKPVNMANLIPGDLVFFRLQRKVSHVGLYIGNGMFIHAPSTGKSVQRSRLDNPFWRQRWVRGGRFN